MSPKKHTPEQIISKLRKGPVLSWNLTGGYKRHSMRAGLLWAARCWRSEPGRLVEIIKLRLVLVNGAWGEESSYDAENINTDSVRKM